MSGAEAGRFIAIVGPSGAGKDSLIAFARQELASDARIAFPKRIITRAPDATEQHESVDELTFRRIAAAGGLALQWQAHGLSYGIPAVAAAEIARGRVVVVNLSRSVIPVLRQRFPGSVVVAIQASPDVLAARLAGRGREQAEDQRARLERAVNSGGHADIDELIVNDGALDDAGRELVAIIARQAGAPAMRRGAI